MSRRASKKKKRSNKGTDSKSTSASTDSVETKKLNTGTGASKLPSPRPSKSPKTLKVFEHDLPHKVYQNLNNQDLLAIDTETGGLDYRADPLLLVQIGTDSGRVYMVRRPDRASVRLISLLSNPYPDKVFHFLAFDYSFLKAGLGINTAGKLECTKTLTKIIYPEHKSGLASALKQMLSINIDKKIDHNKWNVDKLTQRQLEYAAGDVLYLPRLLKRLKQEAGWGDLPLYRSAIHAITTQACLEVEGYTDLLGYEQHEYSTTLSNRNWWRKQNNYHFDGDSDVTS